MIFFIFLSTRQTILNFIQKTVYFKRKKTLKKKPNRFLHQKSAGLPREKGMRIAHL